METACVDLFQLDHVTVEMSRDDVAAIEAHLPDLQRIVRIAGRETTHAESGSWHALYLGNSAGYVEIIECDTALPASFSVSLRSRKKGALDDLQAALKERSVAHTLYTERLTGGAESMDWFRCIEIGTGEGRIPLFFNEYCRAFLEDCGVTEETMDRLGATDSSAAPFGFDSVTMRVEGPDEALLSVLDPHRACERRGRRRYEFRLGDDQKLIVESAPSTGLSEVKIPASGVLERAIHTVGGWVFRTAGNTLVMRHGDKGGES